MKYFCVGHFKTGTTSYSKAMRLLGLNDLHFPRRYVQAMEEAGGPVAWDEAPWDSMSNLHEVEYVQLQELYPDARFILTTRDVDKWLASIQKHMLREWEPEVRTLFDSRFQKIFGMDCDVEQFDTSLFRDAFLKHDAEVRDRFGSELLALDLDSDEDLMQKIAGFVGHGVRYPRANKTPPERKPGEAAIITLPNYQEAV